MNLYNQDCLPAMKEMPDNAFSLAIVDPPYGIDDKLYRSDYGKNSGGALAKYSKNRWDVKPNVEYFNELIRTSKNQIVWGGNYFTEYLEPNRCWICWNKDNSAKNFSSIELAWTSFDLLPNYYYYAWGGLSECIVGRNKKEKSIHPTQKPVALYKWLLTNYAKPGQTILDTHLGSGSIAIACHDYGYDLTAYEIDKEYFEAATGRIERHKAQGQLFQAGEAMTVESIKGRVGN